MLRGRHYQFEQPATQRALLNVMKFTMVLMGDVNSIGTVATQQAPSEQPASTHKHLAITLGCSNGNGVIYMAWVILATVLWIPGFQRGKEGPSAPASPSSNQQRRPVAEHGITRSPFLTPSVRSVSHFALSPSPLSEKSCQIWAYIRKKTPETESVRARKLRE